MEAYERELKTREKAIVVKKVNQKGLLCFSEAHRSKAMLLLGKGRIALALRFLVTTTSHSLYRSQGEDSREELPVDSSPEGAG